jgi:uncharacterized protein (DUF433 family)
MRRRRRIVEATQYRRLARDLGWSRKMTQKQRLKAPGALRQKASKKTAKPPRTRAAGLGNGEPAIKRTTADVEPAGANSRLVTRKRGVCGGVPIVARTRIPIWVLVRARQAGIADAELLLDYPQLSRRHLKAAWTYAEAHAEEIDRQVAENEAK